MSTNYYWHNPCDKYGEASWEHIGKQSASGKWCWSCQLTLCYQGNDGVHATGNTWANACVRCGQTSGYLDDDAVEHGVLVSCSFNWAIDPIVLMQRMKGRVHIKDEYGVRFSKKKFWEEVMWCRIHGYDSIGRDFS